MKQIVLLTTIILTVSCISEVDIQLPENGQVITLNSILTPGSDTIIAHLSYTRPLLSSEEFEDIADARLRLYENGSQKGQFVKSDTTAWRLIYRVKKGGAYKIEATVGDEAVWGVCTVPNNINVKIFASGLLSSGYEYFVSFADTPGEDNYYWVTATGYAHYCGEPYLRIAGSLCSNYSLADDFNRYVETFLGYSYCYEDYIRIPDKILPGDSINCLFNPTGISINNGPQKVFVLSVDYNLDKYMKSSLLMEENDFLVEEFPMVYSPFPVYSNINNGTGIVGAYHSASKVFKKE